MAFRSEYGGLYPIITSREMNRLHEIIQRCGIDLGAAYMRDYVNNPMRAMITELDSDFTKLSPKQFVGWLRLLEEQLLEWFREQQKFDSEEIRWSTTWDTSRPGVTEFVDKTQIELQEHMKDISICLQDLQTIRKNVRQRYYKQQGT